MYRWELVKGKEIPKELGMPDFETGPGVSPMSLVWRITKPLCGTGKTVIMDSGFYMLKGLICMYDIGVHGSALVKKLRYWPSEINGN